MWIIRDINQKQKSTTITNNHKDIKPLRLFNANKNLA